MSSIKLVKKNCNNAQHSGTHALGGYLIHFFCRYEKRSLGTRLHHM